LWTLATATVTVFAIAADATMSRLRTWIDKTRGVLVSDRGTQFGFWVIQRRQICWAHLIRKFAAFSEMKGRPGEIGRDLLLWSRVMLHAWHRVRDGTGARPPAGSARSQALLRARHYLASEDSAPTHSLTQFYRAAASRPKTDVSS
jgi:hypothetical protein